MSSPSKFSKSATDTVAKLRLHAGRCQRLASQIEKLAALKLPLPAEFEERGVEWFENLSATIGGDALIEAAEFLRQVNEAASK